MTAETAGTGRAELSSKDYLDSAFGSMTQAAYHRGCAERYGHDTTSGDSGIPSLTLAAQLTTEAQVWATLALAAAQREQLAYAARGERF